MSETNNAPKAKKVKEVAVVKETAPAVQQNQSVEGLISQALASGASVEVMERMFTLREKVKAEQAREAFVEAMTKFQSACPIIEKTKVVLNKDGKTTRYKFAPIDAIAEQIKKPLVDNGLAYKWSVENKDKAVQATCIVYHKLGHSESSSFEVPIHADGYMTEPQKYASALTFSKRYSLLNALGISTGDEDTDATDVNKEAVPASDKSKIIFLLKSLKQKTATKEEILSAVKTLTGLDVEDANTPLTEIVARLEILVKERNADEGSHI